MAVKLPTYFFMCTAKIVKKKKLNKKETIRK